MPTPVSCTLSCIQVFPLSVSRASTRCTSPRSVNLMALFVRLSKIWVRERRSVLRTTCSSGIVARSSSPFFSARGHSAVRTSSTTFCSTTGSTVRSILPDSTLAKSSRSLMSDSKCLLLLSIVRNCFACSSFRGPGNFMSRTPVNPIIAFKGVRISWEIP